MRRHTQIGTRIYLSSWLLIKLHSICPQAMFPNKLQVWGRARGRQGERRYEDENQFKTSKRIRWKHRRLGFDCLRRRGVVALMVGWGSGVGSMLINNTLYNLKRNRECVYLYQNIFNWTAYTSQPNKVPIYFLLAEIFSSSASIYGGFIQGYICICVLW